MTEASPTQARSRSGVSDLRCAIVTGGLNLGGLGEVVVFLATYLPALGIDVMVLDTHQGALDLRTSTLARELERANVTFVSGRSPSHGRKSLLDWQPSVVSSHASPAFVLDLCKRHRIPYVETLHGMHEFLDGDWRAERQRSAAVSGFVAVSELVRRQYLQVNPTYPSERVFTIPNASSSRQRAVVDRTMARHALGLRDEFLFLSLSRYCLQKNIVGLVGAFDGVTPACPEALLAIAGHVEDDFHFAQAMDRRSRNAHPQRVHLRRHTTSPAAVLAAADAFVLDSFFEGWPLASMEALHAGVPIIISDVGGALEQVGKDGERGYLLPNPAGDSGMVDYDTMRRIAYGRQANTEAFRDVMVSAVRNRQYWHARRNLLRAEAERLFSVDGCISSHAAVLRFAAANSA